MINKINKKFNEALEMAIGDSAFVNMVSGLGTSRDKQSAAEYLPTLRKDIRELDKVYHGDWVAARIINKPAYDSIRAGWYYSKLEDDVNQAVVTRSKELKLNKVLLRAQALSRLHGWSYVLVGTTDDEDLELPLEIMGGDLSFFTVLTRDQVRRKKEGSYLSADITKGIYNEPEYYEIGDKYNPTYIHHSRIICIEAPDPVGGEDGKPMPILQRVHDTLVRHASVNANAGSLVYESKIDIIRTPDLFKQLRSGLGGAVNRMVAHYASIATLKGNNGMIVLDKDEEYDSKSYSFGGLPELMREFAIQTAGAANMPYSLLFGQSPAGMNSTGDFEMRSYYDNISIEQEHTLREPIERMVEIIAQSEGYQVDDIGLVFNTLWQLDEKTRSEVELNNANRDAVYIQSGVVTESQVAQQLVDDGTYTTIQPEHIALLDSIAGSYDTSTDTATA